MANNKVPSSEYLSERTDYALSLQLAARLGDVKIGVENDDYYERPMGRSFRIADNSAIADRIYDEIQMRASK